MIKLAIYRKRDQTTRGRGRGARDIEKKSTPDDGVRAIVSTRTAITVSDPRYISELKQYDFRSDGNDASMPPPSFTLSYMTDEKNIYKIFPTQQQPSVYQPDFSLKVVPVDVAVQYNCFWTFTQERLFYVHINMIEF